VKGKLKNFVIEKKDFQEDMKPYCIFSSLCGGRQPPSCIGGVCAEKSSPLMVICSLAPHVFNGLSCGYGFDGV